MRISSISRASGMASVEITRRDLDVTQLRAEAGRTVGAKQARRILVIALVLDGHSRSLAAQAGGMDRQTLRDWVHRYNGEGLAGLVGRPRPGPRPRLSEAQMAAVAKWVDDGPDLAADGVVRWRCAGLRDRVAARFEVTLHERSIGKLLHKLNFSSISVCPLHPKTDLAAQETFKKNFADMATAAIPPERAGGPIEVWFQDEARVGQQGTVTRIWAKRGSRPRAKRDRRFTRAYLFGAICPARGTGGAVVLPEIGIDAMNMHLAEISRSISVSATALLILDGAGWHNSPKRVVPENIVLMPLPPYAPELNSVGTVWEYLRGNFLSHCVWNTYDAIADACRAAWKALMAKSDVITSIGTRDWAQVETRGRW
jgi:transposase